MSTVILTKQEIDRIRKSVLPSTENNEALERKAALKNKSQERLKNWPNTLEALRKKKESYLNDKEDKAEADRQELDKQEAELRRINRLETIKKANELLYEQTDRMKMLRSQQLYADVIDTRYKQIETKEKVKVEEVEMEKKYHEDILKQVKEGELKDEIKAKKQEEKINHIKVVRQVQKDAAQKKKEEEQKKEMDEGLRMKEDAKNRLLEDLAKQELRKKQIVEGNLKTAQANAELKLLKEEMKTKEQLAEQERDVALESIEKRKKDLKALERSRFDKQQLIRQKLIDAAIQNLNEKTNTEQGILFKQEQDIRDRDDRMIAEKAMKIQKEWDATVASRTIQIIKKEEQSKQEKLIEDEMVEKWKKENEDAILAEKEKIIRQRQTTIDLKKKLKMEADEKLKLRKQEKIIQMEEDRLMMTLLTDDQKYTEICRDAIAKNVEAGKPVYPLIRALEFSPPQLLAAKTVKIVRHDRTSS